MDRRPKWFLKSSNGLWRACAELGDNSPSLSLSLSECVCACQLVCLCLCVCARTSTLSQSPLLGDGSAGLSGSLEMR